jgi:peptide-methionine (S)-S-oxide reductase
MKIKYLLIGVLFLSFNLSSCDAQFRKKDKESAIEKPTGFETAYFASGCFWCVEAIFESVKGVEEVISGYSGGKASTANYSQVSAGVTDHAESVEVFYDPAIVSYETLLKVFLVLMILRHSINKGLTKAPNIVLLYFIKMKQK